MQVRFRTSSSFLVAYSVNLSKGGAFLETATPAPVGSALTLKLAVGDADAYEVAARVTWVREQADPAAGPAGMGVEFDGIDDALGDVIDQLVTTFAGMTVLVFCPDSQDRATLARMVRSIIRSADVVEAGGISTAEALLGDELDLVVVDGDAPDDGGWHLLRAAKQRGVPVIALCAEEDERLRAHELGADDITDNPPAFVDFQEALLRTLGRPTAVVREA